MPTSTGGDRINFHYNYGDYNNDLKTLTQTQTPNTLLVLSQINREHPIVFRQIERHFNFLALVHTHRRSSFAISLTHIGTLYFFFLLLSHLLSNSHLFIARCSAEISEVSAHERLLLLRKSTIVAKQSMQHLMHECCVSSRKLTS